MTIDYTSPFNTNLSKNVITKELNLESILEIIDVEKEKLEKSSTNINYPVAIFRGEMELFSNPLLPKIFRELKFYKNELSLIEEYGLKYKEPSFNILKLLSKMQHDNIPTRLLDWSKCPKIALFFSCNNSHFSHGVIHVFVPNLSINNISPMKSFSINEIGLYLDSISCGINEVNHIDFWNKKLIHIKNGGIVPWSIPIDEEHLDHENNNKRKVQKGVHTFHPGYLYTEFSTNLVKYRLMPKDIQNQYKIKEARENYITSIIIESNIKQTILEELDNNYGINKKTLLLE